MSGVPELAVSPGKQRTVGDDSRDRTANFRVRDLRLCSEIFPFGGGELSLRLLERSFAAHRFQRVQVIPSHVIGRLGLHQSRRRGVVVSTRNGSFREEFPPRVYDLLL